MYSLVKSFFSQKFYEIVIFFFFLFQVLFFSVTKESQADSEVLFCVENLVANTRCCSSDQ